MGSNPTVTATTLTYDALGRLYSAGGTRFLYDGSDLIAEYDASGNVLHRYVHGPGVDEPLVAYDGAGVDSPHWLLADERGSVVGSADAAGAVTPTAFDDYGAGSPVSRFGFTGQAWLPEAGVYHFKARAYSPKLGRFLQPDPSADPDSPSLYAYAGNDPVNATDPSGLEGSNDRPVSGVDVIEDYITKIIKSFNVSPSISTVQVGSQIQFISSEFVSIGRKPQNTCSTASGINGIGVSAGVQLDAGLGKREQSSRNH